MKSNRFRSLCAILVVATLTASGWHDARAATAEPSGLEPELASKVAREKLRQGRRGAAAAGSDAAQCGNVSIGNDDADDRRASRRLAERSRTVIVTGDVINAARCR